MVAVKCPVNPIWVVRRYFMQKPRTVITVPRNIEAAKPWWEKNKKKILKQKSDYLKFGGDKKFPVITCEHIPQYNFYLNQTYSKKREVPIASLGWKNRKHKGDKIVFHPHGPNPHFASTEADLELNFSHTGLSPLMVDVLRDLGYNKPTHMQFEVIPPLLRGESVMCSGETGCGKTLAYLAPTIDIIYRNKEKRGELKPRHPYAMIVLPTKELVYQIGILAKDIASKLNVGVSPMIGGPPSNVNKELAHTGYDLIITTPGLLRTHIRSIYHVDALRLLIFDEADTVLDDSFSDLLSELLENLRFKSSDSNAGVQFVLVSATIPQDVEKKLGGYVDMESFRIIESENVHQVQPHVKHVFKKIHKYDRALHLLQLIDEKLRKRRRIVIFTNERKQAKWLYHYLLEHKIDCVLLSKALETDERLEKLNEFNREDVNICVSTDLGSRGVDYKDVTDVINFDCPVWVADYIHRAGRTGRVGCGKDCCVTSFVSFKQAVNVINQLELSLRTYTKIPFVDGNIKKARRNVRNAKISGLSKINERKAKNLGRK